MKLTKYKHKGKEVDIDVANVAALRLLGDNVEFGKRLWQWMSEMGWKPKKSCYTCKRMCRHYSTDFCSVNYTEDDKDSGYESLPEQKICNKYDYGMGGKLKDMEMCTVSIGEPMRDRGNWERLYEYFDIVSRKGECTKEELEKS